MNYIKRHYKIITTFAVLIVVYLFQIVTVSPENKAADKYNLSTSQLILLSLAIALPYITIWLIGLFGYLRLNSYADVIRKNRDGQAMQQLSRGVLWLLLWLPITAVVGGVINGITATHPGFEVTGEVIDIYVGVAILLPAYYFLYDGSRKIVHLAKTQKSKKQLANQNSTVLGRDMFLAAYAVVSAVYIYMLFSHGGLTSGHPAPYVPDWVYLLTVVVPRLVMWFLGLAAIWNLYKYGTQITGKIYQKSFRSISTGLVMITIGLISIVLISSIGDLTGYSLAAILAIVYALLVIIAAGYISVAVGATGLYRIEKA